jgi:polar amino acid transport system substrate-binding protein
MMRRVLAIPLLLACAFAAAGIPALVRAETRSQEQGAPLRVATMPLEPLVIEDGDRLTGFSVDLWDAVARQLGREYQWVKVQTVEELLAAVEEGRADVGISGVSMTADREKAVDFTLPYFNAGLRVMTSTRSSSTLRDLMGIIFSPALLRVFALAVLILFVMAHVIWLVEHETNEAIPKAYLPGVWESMWWSLATLATQEYGVLGRSRRRFPRLLAMVWVVLSIVLIAEFTASVTAALTVHQLTGSIHGPSDLPGKRIATVRGTTAADYLSAQHLTPVEVSQIDDAYALLQQGQVQAVVFDGPVLLYHAATKGKGVAQVVGETLRDEYYGIALPSGSSLRKPINEALLELMQNGAYTEIHNKWFGAR